MCCTGAKWKREVVQDHKFDFVDVHEYHTTGFFTRLRYALIYIFLVKSILVYISDIYTIIAMLAKDHWAGNILSESDESSTIKVPFTIGKWIFLGCIIVSFLLLAWESRKARMIIRSRDISYAFTNVMANNYYSMKSYDHFCFFSQINNSKKKKDEFAFFVFFTFKGWKRLLLADAPRQVINALTLYSFGKAFNFTTDISKYYNNSSGEFSIVRAGVLCTMIFTVVVWCGSAILLAIAAFMYIPLLCYIQGNLKEYCCHKIDKRIAELMKRKTKKRVAREAELAKREAAGDFRHLQDKKGRFKDGQQPLPQPTLPNVSLADDELYAKSEVSSYRNGGGKGGGGGYNYPPMPSMPDHAYSGYPDMQNGGIYHPQYQFSENGHMPGNDSSYSLAQAQAPHLPYQAGYGYPPSHNDSTASFGHMNDDGASIKSRDPLLHMGDQSQLSLNRAPSYKTREDDDGAGSTYDFGRVYENYGSEKGDHQQQQQQSDYFSPDPAHPYAEPPYTRSNYTGGARSHSPGPNGALGGRQTQQSYHSQPRSHPSSHNNSQDFDMQTPRTQSPAQMTQASSHPQQYGETQVQPVNFNPQARGVSIAGRSEISTFYYNEHRDRASMADSHAGAFDLDEYARSSMFAPNAVGQGQQQNQQWQNQYAQQRSSRLDYLEEEVEDDAYQQQPQRNNQNDHQSQRDWRR